MSKNGNKSQRNSILNYFQVKPKTVQRDEPTTSTSISNPSTMRVEAIEALPGPSGVRNQDSPRESPPSLYQQMRASNSSDDSDNEEPAATSHKKRARAIILSESDSDNEAKRVKRSSLSASFSFVPKSDVPKSSEPSPSTPSLPRLDRRPRRTLTPSRMLANGLTRKKSRRNSDDEPPAAPPPSPSNYVARASNCPGPSPQRPIAQTHTAQTPTAQTSTAQTSTAQTPTGKTPTGQTPTAQTEHFAMQKVWLHEKLDFLKPDKIRDLNKKRREDPDYDARTLFVPESFLNNQTPAMRQWWIIKSNYYDTILFFKVGKFYELYHMDAVVGVAKLGFTYMRGEFAHSGFPEIAYGRMASSLIEMGYKVTRVEQTETPEMMSVRLKDGKRSTKFDKVVNREVCEVTTKGVCLYGAQLSNAKEPLQTYMLAICEDPQFVGADLRAHHFGVCLIDTSIGKVCLGQFHDDKYCSRLLAMLSERKTSLIITERGSLTNPVKSIIQSFGHIKHEILTSGKQFYSVDTTINKLQSENYFLDKDGQFAWPEELAKLLDNGEPLQEYKLAIKALGGCLWYLINSKLDVYILSMKQFELYVPIDTNHDKTVSAPPDYMIMDYATMKNLNIFGNEGSLEKLIDYCSTPFGRRLLKEWLCRPLCNLQKIRLRQAAIEELLNHQDVLHACCAHMRQMPDLQRNIAKIHTFGNWVCAKSHPNSRAIFYESKLYDKRKIITLLNTLDGFKLAAKISELFGCCNSTLLSSVTQYPPKGKFIDLTAHIDYFAEAFDQQQAKEQGKIIPRKGVDEEFDQAEEAIAEIQLKLDKYLAQQQKIFGCKMAYFGNDKKRYQLEIPADRSHKVTNEYTLEGTRKGAKPVKRYSTPATKKLLADMLRAEDERAKIVRDLNRRVFEKFGERMAYWEESIHCLAILDCICALTEYARRAPNALCLPELSDFAAESTIRIEDGLHPCIETTDFIPNDFNLDGKSQVMVLTGPNMGGKSTIMKQIAVTIILAQIGSYVPAKRCQFNLVDRIFTRIGASDDILRKQSTFFVELSEAATILKHATSHSFVLIDELGRGTSTYDGNAIATAYLEKLLSVKCRSIFSTHYHSLVEYYSEMDCIQLAHMSYILEGAPGGTDDDDEEDQEQITFLYKLAEGACPQSQGMYTAKLAGIPLRIIRNARRVAKQLERSARIREVFQTVLTTTNTEEIMRALEIMSI